MAPRVYLLPKVQYTFPLAPNQTPPASTYWGPKHEDLHGRWVAVDLGAGGPDWMLVRADPTPANHLLIVADPLVTALPEDLDQTLGVAGATLAQTKLEAASIPADWIQAGQTWRQVVRRVAGICRLLQALSGLRPGITRLLEGRDWSATLGSLPIGVRNRLTQAADVLGIDTTGLGLGSTLRQVAARAVQHFANEAVRMGGAV